MTRPERTAPHLIEAEEQSVSGETTLSRIGSVALEGGWSLKDLHETEGALLEAGYGVGLRGVRATNPAGEVVIL